MRAAIEAPARQAGLIVEPGLIDLLVREVANDPGALPLLSHALRETWQRREGGPSPSPATKPPAESAERSRSPPSPCTASSTPTSGAPCTTCCSAWSPRAPKANRSDPGCRAARSSPDPAQDELVDLLVRSRLVTSDDGVVEIAHEALARAWPRLRGWLEDDVEGQRILHHLSATADAWDALGRPRQRAVPRRPAGAGAGVAGNTAAPRPDRRPNGSSSTPARTSPKPRSELRPSRPSGRPG